MLVRYSLSPHDPPRESLGSKQDRIKVCTGDVLEWVTWGGGGWGDPLERDPESVGLEVRRRLVTRDGARRYGVVIDGDGKVDVAATAGLRGELVRRNPASAKEVFDRGGSWKELRARCQEETGLPAPVPPAEVDLRGPVTQLQWFKEWKEKHRLEAERCRST